MMIYYEYSQFKFLAELILAIALFVFTLNRRRFFPLLLIISLSAVGFIAYFFWPTTFSISSALLYTILCLRYFALFIGAFLCVLVCFKVPVWTALFCSISGYATQHIAYKLWDLCEDFLFEKLPYPLFIVFYILFFVVNYTIIYFVFARRITRPEIIQESNKGIILLGITLIVFTVFLHNSFYWFVERTMAIRFIISTYACLCCVFLLCIQAGMFKSSKEKMEFQMMKQFWHKEKQQLALTKEYIDIINIKCHDMKQQLSVLSAGKISEEEINELKKIINIYDSSVSTGNDILDIVVAEKSLRCHNEQISLYVRADAENLGFMSATDVFSLFGNIIDNAMDAARKLPKAEMKTINLEIIEAKGLMSIHCENYYAGDVVFVDGIPQTTKDNKLFHGFGLKSISVIVQKYNGYMKINPDGEIFYLDIILPLS